LISVGAYEAGSDPVLDTAIGKHNLIEQFLQQDISERADMEESVQLLAHVLAD